MKHPKYDFYSVNDTIDFAYMPIIEGITDKTIPIRLQRGDSSFGSTHIDYKHKAWLQKNKTTAPEMVWIKLQQSGFIYTTEEDDKLKVVMRMPPAALVVLRFIEAREPFFSIVSVYFREGQLDGTKLGIYPSTKNDATPEFTIPDLPKTATVFIKKKRMF